MNMGRSSSNDPDEVAFTPLHENFLKKHGRVRCPCCREDGIDRVVEIGPSVRGAVRKAAAVCRDHEEEGRAMFRRAWLEAQPDHSDAAFALGL